MNERVDAPRVRISDEALPALFRAADASAVRSRSHFLWATRVRLAALAATAPAAAFTFERRETDWAGVVLLGFFLTALFAELFVLRVRPERTWYDGRAAAESVKTVAWKYMVGGLPFDASLTDHEAADLLADRLNEVRQQFPGIHWVPVGGPEQLTDTMVHVRSLDLPARQDIYVRDRIRDQEAWYGNKAKENRTASMWWSGTLVTIEAVGVCGAVLKSAGLIKLDIFGVAGALATAGIAWAATKQFSSQAEAYGVASQELGIIEARIPRGGSESAWAKFVDEAEDAISREHTTWRASRSWPIR